MRELLGDCGECTGCGLDGDLICLASEGEAGKALIQQLKTYYASIGNPAKWASAVSAITVPADDLAKSIWIAAFNPKNCTLRQYGEQAQALMRKMAEDTGHEAPESMNLSKSDLSSTLPALTSGITTPLLIGVGVLGAIYFLGMRKR